MIKVAARHSDKPRDRLHRPVAGLHARDGARTSRRSATSSPAKSQKELNVPVGMISTNWGGTICEAWTSKEALGRQVRPGSLHRARPSTIDKAKPNPNQPTVLYNGMINPLVPYGIRGRDLVSGRIEPQPRASSTARCSRP